jgi:hypothetical protein
MCVRVRRWPAARSRWMKGRRVTADGGDPRRLDHSAEAPHGGLLSNPLDPLLACFHYV